MENINKIIWIVAISFLFLNALYYSIKLGFPQLKLKKMIKILKPKEKENGISAKDTLAMSLASKIGIGSLAGIAFAIYYGGIGTIFWIWITTFLIVINSFVENYLSIKYKEKDNNFYKGGPAYYIKNGLNKKILSKIYAIVLIVSYILGFLSIQSNTTVVLINNIYPLNKVLISVVLCFFSMYFIFKGLKTISNLCNKIVPFMSILYIVIGTIIIIANIKAIPDLFNQIFTSAFSFRSISGGFLVMVSLALQRSIFSSESGIGTGAIAAGASNNKDPIKQGYIGVFETYFINLFIATMTTFIIGLSNYSNVSFDNINGIELTKYAFSYHLGNFGSIILLLLVILFAFSTIVTGYYYGESNLKIFTNNKGAIVVLKIFTIIILFWGGITPSLVIWKIVDILVGLLAIINIYSLFKLRKEVDI